MNAPARVDEDRSAEARNYDEVEQKEWLDVIREYELEGLGAD